MHATKAALLSRAWSYCVRSGEVPKAGSRLDASQPPSTTRVDPNLQIGLDIPSPPPPRREKQQKSPGIEVARTPTFLDVAGACVPRFFHTAMRFSDLDCGSRCGPGPSFPTGRTVGDVIRVKGESLTSCGRGDRDAWKICLKN